MNIVTPKTPVPRNTVRADGEGSPLIIPREGGKVQIYKRASSYLCWEDKEGLKGWRDQRILDGIPSHLEAVQARTSPDRAADKALMSAIFDSGGGSDASERGTHLHGLTELVDQGLPLPPSATLEDHMLMDSWSMITEPFRVMTIECFVVNEEMRAGGTYDRKVTVDPGLCCDKEHVLDLKTSEKCDYGKLSWPSQLSLYAHGVDYDPAPCAPPPGSRKSEEWKAWRARVWSAEEAAACYPETTSTCTDRGFVVLLPRSGATPKIYAVDLQKGLELNRISATVHEARKMKNTIEEVFSLD